MADVQAKPMKAAVIREKGGSFSIEDAHIGVPRHDEVLVRVVAVGVCHTDMVVRDQLFPSPLPAILGHEGAGVVEAVGADVHHVVPGDHVVMSYMFCGECYLCGSGHPAHCLHVGPINFGGGRLDGSTSASDANGEELHDHFFGQSSFAEYAIANRNNVVKVPKDLPLDLLAPLGCGLQTGAGAVLNAMKVSPGSTFAAFGTGAVGLAALMAARVAGATRIIAVDVNADRLALAKELGATHTVNSREGDPVAAIQAITEGKGADFTLECSGRAEVLRQAVDALGFFGTCGIVGATPMGTEVAIDVNGVMIPAKKIMGVVQGDVVSATFIPTLIELYRQGRFPFDRLIKHYDFADINQAVEDSESGRTIKPVLRIAAA
jgi:aryl-alcohol dehydrogenase